MFRKMRTESPEALFWIVTFAGAALIAGLLWLIDFKWLHEHIQRLPAFALFLALVFLPLLGVPVSVLFATTGAKFGSGLGLAATALAIALHLILSWWIAHSWFKRPLAALLHKLGRNKPELLAGDHVPVCLLVALFPGMSYALKNYLLVLADVPFRKLFWTCLPAHLFHASLAIFLGDFLAAITTPKIIFLSAYAVVLIGLSHHVVRRLKRRGRPAKKITPILSEKSDRQ
jgi:uncharacterized membrane protein YdjX (TVP38/TMEM64 family)